MPPADGSPRTSNRLPALRRFAVAITILNVLGHFVLGFEQSWAQPLVALATAYRVELILEGVGAWAERRPPQFRGGWLHARRLPAAGPHHGPGGLDAALRQRPALADRVRGRAWRSPPRR